MCSKSQYKITPLVVWCILGVSFALSWCLSSYWRIGMDPINWYSCPFIDNNFGSLWKWLDDFIFHNFNGSLGTETNAWNFMWAIANYRAFDLISSLSLFILLWLYARDADDADESVNRIAIIIGSIAYVVISSQLIKYFLYDIDRHSATIVYRKSSTLLSDLYPSINPKDMSKNSFPGDHAIILVGYSVAMFKYAKKRYSYSTVALTIIFILPRLVSGAHWTTDILVGACSTIMVSMAIYFYTPVYLYFEKWFKTIFNKIPLPEVVRGALVSK